MKVCSLPAAGTLAAAVLGMAELASTAGGLQPQGAEFQLTRNVPGDQVRPRLSLDARGGWMLWQDAAIDGDGLGIAGVRVGPETIATQGPAVAINAETAGDQENPAIAGLPDGGAFAVWQGGRQGFQRIHARVLNAAGKPVGGEIAVSTGDGEQQADPAVAVLRDGSVVVVWSSYRQDGSFSYDIYGRRFSAAGDALSEEFRINAGTGMNRRAPAISGTRSGGFLCAWVSERQVASSAAAAGSRQGIVGAGVPSYEVAVLARPFQADGTAAGPEQRVSDPLTVASHPELAALPGGHVVAAWTRKDGVDASRRLDIACRLLDASGAPAGQEHVVNTTLFGDQYLPRLAVSSHGALAIWTSMGQDGSWEGVFGRWLDSSAVPSGDEIPVNGQIGGGQIHPAVAAGPDGNLVVAWSSNLPRVGFEVFAQRLAPLLLRAEPAGNGRMRLIWPTVLGGLYQLQISRDGRVWSDVGGSRAAVSDTDSTEISASGQVVLYRVLRAR